MSQELKHDKGAFNGSCNRTACQAPGATWYNHSTRLYYCPACAGLINYPGGMADALRLFGHAVCTPGPPGTDPLPASVRPAELKPRRSYYGKSGSLRNPFRK